jgi:D-arginine dehydrogenase
MMFPPPVGGIIPLPEERGKMEQTFDVVVIGAGMAGASVAAFLSEHCRVALLEAEEAAGYHTTGRSAALWLENYGPPDVRLLTRLSRAFFTMPPDDFATVPLLRPRKILFLAEPHQMADLDQMIAGGSGLRGVSVAEAKQMLPALRDGYAAGAAVEDDAFDLDVSAIHQGFLRQLRTRNGVLALRNRAGRITRAPGVWHVETASGAVFQAGIVVDAAGAWGDEVAVMAGVAPIGLLPKRRTAAIIDPSPWDAGHWPMVLDVGENWYARPEARTRLMVSPADETLSYPHDVQPEEIDIATGIDHMQRALAIEVRRVEHSWAGLRTFTPDGSLAFGWDPGQEGFFWCVGQGGYGIQTSPAAGRLAADLILGRSPGDAAAAVGAIDPKRFHAASRVDLAG